jgi:hypothetical protein
MNLEVFILFVGMVSETVDEIVDLIIDFFELILKNFNTSL